MKNGQSSSSSYKPEQTSSIIKFVSVVMVDRISNVVRYQENTPAVNIDIIIIEMDIFYIIIYRQIP